MLHALVPVPDRLLARTYCGAEEEEAGVRPDQPDRSFDPDHNGRAWEVAKWGCRCGATVVNVTREGPGQVAYDFDTPWDPPLRWVEQASLLFPSLAFRLEFR